MNNKPTYTIQEETAKNGKPIIKINGIYIHSKFRPDKEANTVIHQGKHLIAVFGIGYAYHVNNILENNPDSLFIIYEPCTALHQIYHNHLDQNLLTRYSRRVLLLNSINTVKIQRFLQENNYRALDRLITYSNRGYNTIFKQEALRYYREIEQCIKTVVQNILTETNFIPLWTKNILTNIGNIDHYPLLFPRKDDRNTNIAVIVCAGPTLSNDLAFLEHYRDSITIFTVDTALKPLLKHGITPDFIVSLDSQFYSLDDFPAELPAESVCLFDITSYPPLSRHFTNIYYTITANIFNDTVIDYFFKQHTINETGIYTGGTVSDYCINLAIALGFKTLYLTGLDLSFPYLQSHAKESPYYRLSLSTADYFNTLDTRVIKTLVKRRPEKVTSKKENSTVFSDFILQNYAHYINTLAGSNPDIHIYNTPYHGIKINNLTEITLPALLKEQKSIRIAPDTIMEHCAQKYIDKKAVMLFYTTLETRIYQLTQTINEYLSTIDFTIQNDVYCTILDQFIQQTYQDFPFLKKFVIMTEMILDKKNITSHMLIWYKHILFRLVQSAYYIIRIIKKNKNSF